MSQQMTPVCIAAETVALSGYLLAAVAYPVRLLRPGTDFTRWGRWGLVFSATLQGLGLAAHLTRAPAGSPNAFANISFTLVLLLCAAIWYIHRRTQRPAMAGFLTPIVFLVAVVGLVRPSTEVPEIRAWFLVHVALAFLAYAAFGVAFAMAMAYLVNDWSLKHKRLERLPLLPPLTVADDVGHLAVVIGVALLTLSLVVALLFVVAAGLPLGGKVAISGLVWLNYVAYLVLRDGPHWRGRRLQALLLFGFALALGSFVLVPHSRAYSMSPPEGVSRGTPNR